MLQHTGIGTYLRGLLSGFQAIGFGAERGLTLWGSTPGSATRKTSRDPFAFQAPIYSLREQFLYPRIIRQCALWHSPHYNVPFSKGRTKLVVTIHDIIHWLFRKQLGDPFKEFYARTMMRRALAIADHVIAVSQNTKRDLAEHFQADPQKITVIHEGVSPEYRELSPAQLAERFEILRRKYALPEVFFLYVGLLKPHKNIHRLVRVFRKLKDLNKLRSDLVLVGRKDKRYPSEFKALAELRSGNGIWHIPRVEPNELPVFYNQALALVHPSLYEGFGLTVPEAMKCGTPVISSNAASLPEVAGDAAALFDPLSETALADALVRIESDATFRESLRMRGLARSAIFDWQETARKTVEVYERVLAEK